MSSAASVPTTFGLAVASEQMVAALTELARPTGNTPRPGSPAAAACAAECYPGEHPWTAEPHRDAFVATMLSATGASECLLSMGDALLSRRPTVADAMARTTVEIAARVWYVFDRRISEQERVRRFTNDKLYGFAEGVSMVNSLPDIPDTRGVIFQEAIKVLLAEARRHGFHVTAVRQGKAGTPYLGAKRPGSGPLVDKMFAEAADLKPGTGQGFYRIVSASPHASLHGHFSLYEVVDGRARLQLRPPSVARKLHPAILAYHIMGEEIVYQFGLEPTAAWKDAALAALATWEAAASAYEALPASDWRPSGR